MEVKLGRKDPSRPHHPKDNPNQRGDGVFGNWTTAARNTVFDGTCVTAVHHGMLGPLARGKCLATDYAEETKRKAKVAAFDANNLDLSPLSPPKCRATAYHYTARTLTHTRAAAASPAPPPS